MRDTANPKQEHNRQRVNTDGHSVQNVSQMVVETTERVWPASSSQLYSAGVPSQREAEPAVRHRTTSSTDLCRASVFGFVSGVGTAFSGKFDDVPSRKIWRQSQDHSRVNRRLQLKRPRSQLYHVQSIDRQDAHLRMDGHDMTADLISCCSPLMYAVKNATVGSRFCNSDAGGTGKQKMVHLRHGGGLKHRKICVQALKRSWLCRFDYGDRDRDRVQYPGTRLSRLVQRLPFRRSECRREWIRGYPFRRKRGCPRK